jgi:hypothetical protein
MRAARSRSLLAAVTLLALVAAACGPGGGPETTSLTPAEQQFGRSPAGDAQVTYQPDVVILGGGASSVKAWSSDGLTWTIKGGTPGLDQLAPGKIMYVTSFGVGRVLAVNPVGSDRAVTIGPVSLTDVIRDADIPPTKPISLGNATFLTAPDLPGVSTDGPTSIGSAEPIAFGDGEPPPAQKNDVVLPPLRLAAAPQPPPPGTGPSMPPPSGSAPSVSTSGFKLKGECCANGLGITMTYDEDGLEMTGFIGLQFASASLSFQLHITGGRVTGAELQGGGAVGVAVNFNAATNAGREANINKRIEIPVQVVIPIFGIGKIGFYAELTQWFVLKTAFSSKDSTLRAAGVFSFGGTLGFSYDKGTFTVHGPEGFAVKQSLTDSITGLSIGAAGLVIAHQMRLCVCLGAFGFATGLHFMMTSSFGVTNDSSAQAVVRGVRCHGTSLDMVAVYGWGYMIPKPVADLVNAFLSIFHARPISNQGGTFSAPKTLLHRAETVPQGTEACGP